MSWNEFYAFYKLWGTKDQFFGLLYNIQNNGYRTAKYVYF